MKSSKNIFFKKDFISVEQFKQKKDLDAIFLLADKMQASIKKRQVKKVLKNFCITELFYQPSTRTFTSFMAASKFLGAITIPIHGMQAYSSAVKGETLPDTIRTVEQTTACDLIILRHPENSSSDIAAEFASVPIVNAGSGSKEHPTQALLDLYTIKKKFKKIDGLKIILLGDLKYGRTAKSLAKLMSIYAKKIKLILVSPKDLRMPKEEINKLKAKGVHLIQTENLKEVIGKADILYATRIQKEWFQKERKMALYNKLKDAYLINNKIMKKAKKKMILIHPFPRVGEIAAEVDKDPRSFYFEQMRNGLYIRMALLRLILLGE